MTIFSHAKVAKIIESNDEIMTGLTTFNKEFIDLRKIICLRKFESFDFSKLALVCMMKISGEWHALQK